MGKPTDPDGFFPDMERIDSDVMERVLERASVYEPSDYGEDDVLRALSGDSTGPEGFGALLSPAAEPFLERIARRAAAETARRFGNSVSLFTPLYASNHCSNECVYCGFNRTNPIRRSRLDRVGAEREMRSAAEAGIRDILLLTGESREHSGTDYIADLVSMASEHFSSVGLEVYPLNTDEYRRMRMLGADHVTVFQETYDRERYSQLHPSGRKRVFPYRFDSQERALRAGMRGVAFAPLLGLSDFRRDSFACGMHAREIQRRYPHAEISFSLPRLRPFPGGEFGGTGVSESDLLQVSMAYRLFMPFAGQTVSTRERPVFRDNLVRISATRMSAGVSVSVGGRSGDASGDGQFDISDSRSVKEVTEALVRNGRQPVFNNYVRT